MDNEKKSAAEEPTLVIQAEYVGQTEVANFDTCTQEAWNWFLSPISIPDAPAAPVLMTGLEPLQQIAFYQGHSITLEEAKVIVRPDGPDLDKLQLYPCEYHKAKGKEVMFQPVKYIPYVTDDLAQQLSQGVPLAKCRIWYLGNFVSDVEDKPMAYSGARYFYLKKDELYKEDTSSPLYKMMEQMSRKIKARIWPKIYAEAMRRTIRREMNTILSDQADRTLIVHQYNFRQLGNGKRSEIPIAELEKTG